MFSPKQRSNNNSMGNIPNPSTYNPNLSNESSPNMAHLQLDGSNLDVSKHSAIQSPTHNRVYSQGANSSMSSVIQPMSLNDYSNSSSGNASSYNTPHKGNLKQHQQQQQQQSTAPLSVPRKSRSKAMPINTNLNSPGDQQQQQLITQLGAGYQVPMNSPQTRAGNGGGLSSPKSAYGQSVPVSNGYMTTPMYALQQSSNQYSPAISSNMSSSNEPKSAKLYTEPPSPIASISPHQKRSKYTMHGQHARKISADARINTSAISSVSTGVGIGAGLSLNTSMTSYGSSNEPPTPSLTAVKEAKKQTIFSPAYLRKEEEERMRNLAKASKGNQTGAGVATNARQHDSQVAVTVSQVVPGKNHAVVYTATSQQSVQMDVDEFDPLVFIKNLPKLGQDIINRKSPIPVRSPSDPRITLALDLDETLVHCSVQPIPNYDLTFNVTFNGLDYCVYVRLRPYWMEFLEVVSKWFEVLIFTASQPIYANTLLDILDPTKKWIKYRLFRDSCVNIEGNFLKDLHILGRDMRHCCIIDNSIQAFGFQIDQGIPIESWFDSKDDVELKTLLPFLEKLKDAQDVRPMIRETFRLHEMIAKL